MLTNSYLETRFLEWGLTRTKPADVQTTDSASETPKRHKRLCADWAPHVICACRFRIPLNCVTCRSFRESENAVLAIRPGSFPAGRKISGYCHVKLPASFQPRSSSNAS